MKMALLLLVVSLGVAMAITPGEYGIEETFKNPRYGRSEYEQYLMKVPPSVAFSCKNYFEAMRLQDLGYMMSFYDRKSLIISHSKLPAGGVHRGKLGLLRFVYKWAQTANLKEFSYEIRHVDEARGVCIADTNWIGTFRRNNNSFNSNETHIVTFSLGKVKRCVGIDNNFNDTWDKYSLNSEKHFVKFLTAFYQGQSGEVDKYIAPNALVVLPNLYPSTLVSEAQQKVEGRNVSLSLRGKEAFAIFVGLAQKLVLNRTYDVEILYANQTDVVSLWVLKPKAEMEIWNIRSRPMKYKTLTSMYVCSSFNENGLLTSFNALFNRPFLPWQAHQLGFDLMKHGQLAAVKRNATELASHIATGGSQPAPLTATGVTGEAAPTGTPLASGTPGRAL